MALGTDQALRSWAQRLPASRMVYPETLWKQMKYIFWHLYTPLHPFVRDTLVGVGLVRHTVSRQDVLLGTIAPGESVRTLVQYLLENGYANHFIAWKDEGEIVSFRRVVGFEWQYHIRIFEDGEVRGHYEYTPECYPIRHMREIGWEARSNHFLDLLGDRIVPTKEFQRAAK